MKIFLPSLAFFTLVHFAGAGLILVEEMDQTGGPMPGKTEMTITASGDKARVDLGKQISSIVDSKTGTVTSLMHEQKMAMQLPEGTFDSIKKAGEAEKGKSKPELKPTGKKETINGFACEEYLGKIKGMDVTFWVTKEVKNQKEILDQLSNLSGGTDPFQGALASGEDFPGFPIRTIMKTPELGTMTMTVVSIKNEDVPDSAFDIPADYQAISMPKMQLPGGGAPAVPAVPDAR
jgi:hypothetical protein